MPRPDGHSALHVLLDLSVPVEHPDPCHLGVVDVEEPQPLARKPQRVREGGPHHTGMRDHHVASACGTHLVDAFAHAGLEVRPGLTSGATGVSAER